MIDVDDEGWVEDQWCGRAVHIGTAVVQPVVPCERCTMVTRAQPGLLVLYHQLIWGSTDAALLDEVRSTFKGNVVSAKDLDVY